MTLILVKVIDAAQAIWSIEATRWSRASTITSSDRDPLTLHVLLDGLAVLDDDHRLAVQRRAQAREAVAQVRDQDLQDREVPITISAPVTSDVLGQALLDCVADHDPAGSGRMAPSTRARDAR
jgi:hypothetical protein